MTQILFSSKGWICCFRHPVEGGCSWKYEKHFIWDTLCHSAYHSADIAHRLEYLHLAPCLTKVRDTPGVPALHCDHVGSPQWGQVVHWHQILVTLVRDNVQVSYLNTTIMSW